MKALILNKNYDLSYGDIDKPQIQKNDDVLVHVKYCGICGSDMPRIFNDGAHFYPIILGHEFSGVVEEIGSGVSKLKVGDNVSCIPLIPNMDDENSKKGYYAQSKGYSFIGSRVQGGLAEYVVMSEMNAFKLADGITLEQGAFFEPLTVGLHALNIMNYKKSKYVAITGVGTIGLCLLQCVVAFGAEKICVFDIDNTRLEIAKTLGATLVVNTKDNNFMEKALEETGNDGFNVVFETAGVPFTEVLCLKLAGIKGQVMFVGTPHVPLTLQPAEFECINRKELTLLGSWMNYSAPFPGIEWENAAKLFSENSINTKVLIDKIIPASEAAASIISSSGMLKGKILVEF